jgi:MarR family transcriptional regulator, organic hydroperoxide resistance regulator
MAEAERTVNPNLRLDAQVCFALHAASRAFDGLYRVTLRDSGLTYPQYLVMLVLWEYGEMTVKDLGQKLRLDSGTLSPLLKRLEGAGWLDRRRGVTDERSVIVRPTEEGWALQQRICEVPLHTAASTGMDLTQVEELRARLVELTESLDAATTRLADAA